MEARSFCPDCGMPIHACAIDDPPTYSLRVGCPQQRALLPTRRQIMVPRFAGMDCKPRSPAETGPSVMPFDRGGYRNEC